MKKISILSLVLTLLLASCVPAAQPAPSSPTSPSPSAQASPAAAPPATATPSSLPPTQTAQPPANQTANLPVINPSLRIGNGTPTALAVSPDGRWMAVGTQSGVYQYHTASFEPAWFAPLPGGALHLAFDPQSRRLAASAGGDLLLLDAETGAETHRLVQAGGVFAWAPEGERLVTGAGCEMVTVWDAETGAALQELRGERCSEGYSGIHVTWAADGRIYAGSMGAQILAWDGETYAPVEDFSAQGAEGAWISALLAAPTGSLLAQYDSMGLPAVAIIDGQQDRQIHLLDRQANGPVQALAWAPDGVRLAVGYGHSTGLTLVWNAQTGQVVHTLEGFLPAQGLGWSPDGQVLYGLQSPGGIAAVEVNSGRVLRELGGHASAGSYLTWTSEGLVSSNGLALTWWDPDSGAMLRQEAAGSLQEWVVSWPPSGLHVFLYADPRNGLHVGTARYRRPLVSDEGRYPFPTAWSWDGSRLADSTRVWDAGTGELLATLQDPAQQHPPDKVTWSPEGSRLASADSLAMQPPVIWDAETGEVLLTLDSETDGLEPLWLGLAWSPDGAQLAAVGSLMQPDGGEDQGMILIWDGQTGRQQALLTAGMPGYRLLNPAWSPDGRCLASATTGSQIFLWDVSEEKPLARLDGHTDITDQIAWSPEGIRLATAARDGTLAIWDLAEILPEGSAAPDFSRPETVKQAQAVLIAFFERLNAGIYPAAAELYGGSYETLTYFNPTLDPQDHPALLENGCTINGLQCLRVHEVISQEQTGPNQFEFRVSFENDDGTLFELGPCCGASETEMPTAREFPFTVKWKDGQFRVMDLPVYVP